MSTCSLLSALLLPSMPLLETEGCRQMLAEDEDVLERMPHGGDHAPRVRLAICEPEQGACRGDEFVAEATKMAGLSFRTMMRSIDALTAAAHGCYNHCHIHPFMRSIVMGEEAVSLLWYVMALGDGQFADGLSTGPQGFEGLGRTPST